MSVYLTFSPNVDDLRDYKGYFYAKDPGEEDEDLLTKIWYAGAYTIQTNIIAANEGRVQVYGGGMCSYGPVAMLSAEPAEGWSNNGTIASASPVIVDGAKRDRYVVPFARWSCETHRSLGLFGQVRYAHLAGGFLLIRFGHR